MHRVPAVAVEAQPLETPNVISISAAVVKQRTASVQQVVPQDAFQRQREITPPDGCSVPLDFRLLIAIDSHGGTRLWKNRENQVVLPARTSESAGKYRRPGLRSSTRTGGLCQNRRPPPTACRSGPVFRYRQAGLSHGQGFLVELATFNARSAWLAKYRLQGASECTEGGRLGMADAGTRLANSCYCCDG